MEKNDRLIYANALLKSIKSDKVAWRFGVPPTLKLMFDWLRIIIREQPTVDAVEVVRCKDCKWYDPECETCTFWDGIRHPEHFCGEGLGKDNAV